MKLNCTKALIPLAISLMASQTILADSSTVSSVVDADSAIRGQLTLRSNNLVDVVPRNSEGVRVIDMTNPLHEKLVKQRLEMAGRTEAKYPQLHKSLQVQKEQQLKQKEAMQLNDAPPPIPKPKDLVEKAHFFIGDNYGVSTLNGKPFLIVKAKSSAFGGTTATYIDLIVKDAVTDEQLAPVGSTFQVGASNNGKDTAAIATISLESLRKNFPNLTEIVADSFVEMEDAEGNVETTVKLTRFPFSWEHIDSIYKSSTEASVESSGVFGLAEEPVEIDPRPVYTALHPVDRPNDEDDYIKVCLNRQHNDCDYLPDQVGDPNEITDVNIPFEGQIVVPHKVTEIYASDVLPPGIDEPTNIFLQEGYYGGQTKQQFKGLDNDVKLFSEYLTLKVDSSAKTSTISWKIPREEGRFGNAKLFSNINEANWHINFAVKGLPFFKGRRESKMQISVTSVDAEQFGNFYSPVLPKMKLGYSCLAKGTEIKMADGSLQAIETIKTGDMVIGALVNNYKTAQPMEVADVSVGIEAIDMYRVKTVDGKNILMTETHPVSTSNKGIIWAKELELGDRILSAKGTSLVTSIATESYKDNIYNLKLAPVEGSRIEEGAYLGMFANGLLVGDLATQDIYNYKDQVNLDSPEEVLQRVPEKWKVDYLNSLN